MNKKQPDDQSTKNKSPRSLINMIFWVVVIAAVLITILFVCANIFFIIPNHNMETAFIDEALTATLSIIGLAVAVWTGLNIVNAIERKDYEALKNRTEATHRELVNSKQELSEQIKLSKQEMTNQNISYEFQEKERQDSRNKAEKIELLNEMSKTVIDTSTRVLMNKIKNYVPEDKISILSLIELERYFRLVYERHRSDYHPDLKLEAYADDGIKLCEETLKLTESEDLKTYLDYRIADFHYYKGYCVLGENRYHSFQNAIAGYFKTARELGANLPEFKNNTIFPNIDYEGCNNSQIEMSAYICNSIGDSYSKIVEIKEKLKGLLSEDNIQLYEQKAVFYCAYANHWHPKAIYCRNLGVALERQYTTDNKIDPNKFDMLFGIYKKALATGMKSVKEFKTYLSLLDKYFNHMMQIGYVKLPEARKPPLDSEEYINTWNSLNPDAQKTLIERLNELAKTAQQAKTLYPKEIEGYQYMCIFHRNMCMILHFQNSENDKYKQITNHLSQAYIELEYFELLGPNSNMVTILKNDLNDLRKLV